MSVIKVSTEFCFASTKKLTIDIAHKALKDYADKFSHALDLEKSFPIVLDTNVLLSYYGMSQDEKNKLIRFLELNKDRLFITPQVEKEFLKNRIRTINKDFFNPLKNIQTDFQSTYKDIKNKLKSFLESKKSTLSKDYPEIWNLLLEKQQKLNEILEDEEALGEQIGQAIETTTTDYKNIYIVDELLKACSQLNITPALDEGEITFIQQQYDALWQVYELEKDDSKRREITFPGCGDKREKELDPYGDFIIFHEILKFMAGGKDGISSTDVIFLTREKSKGDWMHGDLSPIIHYIEKAYLVTEKTLFIIHAEKPLEISFENIHKENDVIEVDEEELIIRESTIVGLDLRRERGTIYSKSKNLYFHISQMKNAEEFQFLNLYDVVRYRTQRNPRGRDVAVDVEKIVYSFDTQPEIIVRSTVFRIDKDKGYGFISAQPENLYFHYTFLDKTTKFEDLDIGVSVEYILGKNEQGEDIARLVRKAILANPVIVVDE